MRRICWRAQIAEARLFIELSLTCVNEATAGIDDCGLTALDPCETPKPVRALDDFGINLYAFDDPAKLLRAYSSARKQQTSRPWSIAVWARRLRLQSASSLMMAVHSQRRIGKQLEERLNGYFTFDDHERTYFRTLIRLQEAANDAELSALLTKELEALRNKNNDQRGEVMRFSNGKMISLVGEINLVRAQKLLAGTSLEMFPMFGCGTLMINALQYGESSMGPYREFSFSMLVRKRGAIVADLGASFFGGICEHERVRAYFRDHWDLPYGAGKIAFEPLSSREAKVDVESDGQHLLQLHMGAAKMPRPVIANYDSLLAYTEKLQDRSPHRLEICSNEYRRKFDGRIDRFTIDAKSSVGKLLRTLEFCPAAWTYYDELRGRSTASLLRQSGR